jgi:phospholipase/lecithinase/hemolysin
MATILLGLHDVLEVYGSDDYGSLTEKKAEIYARGKLVGDAITDLANKGVKVLVSVALDVGLTPKAQSLGSSEADVLTALTTEFNRGLRENIPNDGRKIGLFDLTDTLRALSKSSSYEHEELACSEGYRNTDVHTTSGVTTSGNLLGCTTQTLSASSALSTYLWADELHPNAYVVQYRLGSLAVSRASDNF